MHVVLVPSLPSLKTQKMNPLKKVTFDERVPPNLQHFHFVFSKDNFDELPKMKPWDHAVELTSNMNPKTCKVYLLSVSEQAKLDAFLKENLKSGQIRLSKSPMAVPVFFV